MENPLNAAEAMGDHSEFIVKDFRKSLRKNKGIVKPLLDFIQYARGPSGKRIVSAFLLDSASMDSPEFIDLLAEKRPMNELATIFEALEVIFLCIADDLQTFDIWAMNMIKQLLDSKNIRCVYQGLRTSNTSTQIKNTLNFLTSMVAVNSTAAREVASRFNFKSETLKPLLFKTNIKDTADVRLCLIHFLMSFLMTGDHTIIAKIIDQKGVLNSVFPGLPNDKVTTIKEFLSALKSQVVENSSVLKTVKIRLLNNYTLGFVFKLFKWRGTSTYSKNKKLETRLTAAEIEGIAALADPENANIVHQLAHEFLVAVCCSVKNGIIFMDNTYGSSGRNANHMITELLKAIEKPYEITLVEETILQILIACPDQMAFYFPCIQKAYEPRPSVPWQKSMQFLVKALKSHDVNKILNSIDKETSANKVVSILLNVISTSVLKRDSLESMVKHCDFRVRDFGLRYVAVVLQQADVASNSHCLKRLLHSTEDLKTFHENLMISLQVLLPSFSSLQQCWDLVTTNSKNTAEAGTDFPDSSALYEHLKMLTSVLNTCIHLFQQASLEFDKETDRLLGGLGRLHNHLGQTEYLEIQTLIFRLLSESSLANSLLIRKVNEKSVTLILCETVLYLNDSPNRLPAEQLMKKLLIATKLFSSMENEIDIWINCFLRSDKPSLSTISFFNEIVIDLVSNSQTHFDETKDHILLALGSSADKEAEGFNKIFDDMLSNDVNANSSLLSDGTGFLLSKNLNLHYSPLVLVALKHLESLTVNDDEISKSLFSVLLNILHGAHQPSVLAHLLQHYLHILPDNLGNVLSYLSGKKMDTKRLSEKKIRKMFDKCSAMGDYVRVMFETKVVPVDGAANALFVKLFSNTSSEEICLVVQQILTYLNLLLTKKNEDEFKDLVSVFCEMVVFMMNADHIVEVDDSSEACQILKDSSNTKLLDKLCCIILNHSVIQDTFLHKRFINIKKDDCIALWQLTRLTLLALKKHGPSNDGENYPLLFSERISDFILQKLSSLLGGDITSIKLPIPLVEIIDPILTMPNLKTACSILDLLIQFSAEQLMLKKKCKINQAGQLLIYILKFIVTITAKVNRPILTAKQFARCAEIYVEIRNYHLKYYNSADSANASCSFGNIYLQLLEKSPLNSAIISPDIFRFCLEDVDSDISLRLATALIWHNLHNVQLFEDLICNNKGMKKDVLKYISLTMAVLCGLNNTCWTKHSKENCQQFSRKLFKLYWPSILSSIFESKDSYDLYQLNVETASNLVYLFVELNVPGTAKMVDFAEKCYHHCSLQTPIPKVVFEAATNLFFKLASSDCMVASLNPSTVFAYLLLKSILVLSKNANEKDVDNLDRKWMIQTAIDFLRNNDSFPNLGKVLHSEKCWHNFIKIMLKDGLRDENGSDMLRLLKEVICRLKHNSELLGLQVTTIFDLIFGHSNFLPGLLNASAKNLAWRETLVDLLTFLVTTEQSVCCRTHIPIYLAAYRATLSSIDQKLLLLMFFYEKHGVDFYSFKPFVWGETAIEHYSLLRSRTQSLWKELSTKEYLSLFDKNKLLKTALNFPLELSLKIENPGDQNCFLSTVSCKELYDPRFAILSFAALLSPESLVYCKDFIKCNGLGLVFAALGSTCKNMRAVAYHVLHDLYEHLEGTKFHLRLPWTSLLNCIRNSMSKLNLQLPNILTVFLVKASQLLLHPADSIAKPIVNYLFIRPELDLWNVPDFYHLFSHPDLTHQFAYRNWLLSTICEGLRTSEDYRICQKRYVFKIILSFYKSPLSSTHLKLQILQVVKAAVKIYPVLNDLIQNQALLASLLAILRDCNEKVFPELMDIVDLAWTSIPKPNLSILIASEFLLMLFSIPEHISSSTPSAVLKKYISCLASVLHWTANKEKKSKAASVCLPTTFIIKVVHFYDPLVEERNSEKMISNQMVSDLTHAHIQGGCDSDVNDVSSVNVDGNGNVCIKLFQDILDTLLCWKPCLRSNESTSQSAASIAEHTSQVFKTVCSLMLKLVSHIGANLQNFKRVYAWINVWLQSDKSSILTAALLCPNQNFKFCDFFAHLFKAYEFLLTVNTKDYSHMRPVPSEDRYEKFDAVVQMSKVFVTIIRKIDSRDGVFANLTMLKGFAQDSFVQLLFSENVREIFNIPDVQSLTVILTGAEIGDNCYKAAVSIAMIAYRLWHQMDELPLFVDFMEKLKMNNSQILSIVKPKAEKRRSSSKEEKRKQKRVCL